MNICPKQLLKIDNLPSPLRPCQPGALECLRPIYCDPFAICMCPARARVLGETKNPQSADPAQLMATPLRTRAFRAQKPVSVPEGRVQAL